MELPESWAKQFLWIIAMGLLPDTQNCGLRICWERRERRERFPRHRLQWKPLVRVPGMHHGTCVTHGPWCMSESLARVGGENVPDSPGACATRNFTYLAWGPCLIYKALVTGYAWTHWGQEKVPPSFRRNFHFLVRKLNFDSNLAEIASQRSNTLHCSR